MNWKIRLSSAFLATLLLTGCSTPQGDFVSKTEEELAQMEELSNSAHNAFWAGNYNKAANILSQLTSERTVSRPLYQLEHLSVLLMDGKLDKAHDLMMKIHADLETLLDTQSEEKAQSLWHGEINKVFKGDSYERATFYAFMALSFINKDNYEDALRCVKNGLLADADSNSADAVEDFALLHYIGFLAASRMQDKNTADDYLIAMKKSLQARGFKYRNNEPAASPDCFSGITPQNNVVLVVWTGNPPTVVCTGDYKEKRNIVRGQNFFDSMSVAVGSGTPVFTPNNLGDVEYQAITRGGRLMDNVLADKAAAKSTMEISSNILLVAGYSLIRTNDPILTCVGAGCFVVGGTAHIVGSMMNPAADGRFWKNLPAQLYIIPLTLPPGRHQIMIQGHRYSDVAGISMFNLDVPNKQGISVFHLPMMTQGAQYLEALREKNAAELNGIINKADANRLAGEIK